MSVCSAGYYLNVLTLLPTQYLTFCADSKMIIYSEMSNVVLNVCMTELC